jgi:hypothetical protein
MEYGSDVAAQQSMNLVIVTAFHASIVWPPRRDLPINWQAIGRAWQVD